MPTYSYKCKECGEVFDAFHSMSCSDSQHCPDCNGVGQKLMSASSVIFKGSGFYSTDYRDSGYLEAKKKENDNRSDTKAENKPESAPASSPDKKAESKPDSKPSTDSGTSTEKSSSKGNASSPVSAAA